MDNKKVIVITDDEKLIEVLELANKSLIDNSRLHARSSLVETNRSTYNIVLQAIGHAVARLRPKKPVWLADEFGDRAECCPNCKNHIVNVWNRAKYEPNYCHYCGQRLKWDTEE